MFAARGPAPMAEASALIQQNQYPNMIAVDPFVQVDP
jgi:hypothetical protein